MRQIEVLFMALRPSGPYLVQDKLVLSHLLYLHLQPLNCKAFRL